MAIAIGYIALVIVLSIVVIATRWAVRRGAPDPDLADAGERDGTRPDRLRPRRSTLDRFELDADGLGPLPGQAEELAMLAGGPQLAALAGVVALRDSGSVEKGGLRGTLVSRRPAPRENRTLRQAIHHRIAEHGPLEVAQLGKLLADDPAMIELRTRLSRDGLLPTVQQEQLLRWCRPTALVLATLGFILGLSSTSLTDSANSAPILIIGVIGSLVLAAGAPPRLTEAGSAVLTAARQRLPGLADGSLSGQHALAVALFGPAALGRSSRKIAIELGLREPLTRRVSSGRGGGGSSGGSTGGDLSGSSGDSGGGHGGGCGGD